MNIAAVTAEFEKIAHPRLAESWDNVGLLLEHSSPKPISTILLTNDLTQNVLSEAIDANADLIYSYHPPIFSPLKHLVTTDWKQRIILSCVEKGIAIYSPHTALDALEGGVNDWLINCFELSSVKPLKQSFDGVLKYTHQVEVAIPAELNFEDIKSIPGLNIFSIKSEGDLSNLKILVCESALLQLLTWLTKNQLSSFSASKCEQVPLLNYGMGRIGKLKEPITIQDAISIIKKHVGKDHLRVSFGIKHQIDSAVSTVAVCAGSGSSVLRGADAELYVTGEMSHHDLLHLAHKGKTVILCEHSNSERGFLKHLATRIGESLAGVKVLVSAVDVDPVVIL